MKGEVEIKLAGRFVVAIGFSAWAGVFVFAAWSVQGILRILFKEANNNTPATAPSVARLQACKLDKYLIQNERTNERRIVGESNQTLSARCDARELDSNGRQIHGRCKEQLRIYRLYHVH